MIVNKSLRDDPGITRRETEDEPGEGGNMSQLIGVGDDGRQKKPGSLKRNGKKGLQPSSVEVFRVGAQRIVEFSALIGRLQVTQHYNVKEMQFQGKLEL
jgi:hypothetical protein